MSRRIRKEVLIQRRVVTQAAAPDGNIVDCLECGHQRRALVHSHRREETMQSTHRGCRRCTYGPQRPDAPPELPSAQPSPEMAALRPPYHYDLFGGLTF